ncbi:MAG: enoyl-[acyl-carrier-protein] reductase FabL [Planctomycetota bacterium]|jgi:enoyl-[acyl-carrier protein] reductase III
MKIDLSGKNALVTGGSRGIGRAIAVRLAEAGARVAINYARNTAAAEETAQMIRDAGSEAMTFKVNLGKREKVHDMCDRIGDAFEGRLDVLVSNAATGVIKPAMELTEHHWNFTMGINAGIFLHLVQHAREMMPEGGSVVAVSSLGALRAIPLYAAVGSSKAALESLVRHLAIELAANKIRINAVSAGVVDTDALKHFPNRDDLIGNSQVKTPAGRLTSPDDVADVVLFMVSPLAKMIIGQTVTVDGGYSVLA